MNDLNRAIGELTAEVRGLRRDVQEDRQTSATHRQGVREELANIVKRQTHLEADVSSMQRDFEALNGKVSEHEKVTVEVKTLRTKAEGAGTVGRWLLRVGIGVVGFAGWAVGVYTWLTGRPPP